MDAHRKLKYRLTWLTIGYAILALIVYLSVTSRPLEINLGFSYQDKLFHALAYFTLMFWFSQIYHKTLQRGVLVVMCVLLGLLMEYVQSFDPHRYAEFADMVANGVGVLLAYIVTRGQLRFALIKFETMLF